MAKTKVPISAQPVHRFPLHRGHVTTSNFMRFDISFARELAKCKIKFNHQEVVRTLALKRPLYSNIMLHNTAIFVPFRTVWEPWTDFKEDTPHNQPAGTGIIKHVPLIGMKTLMAVFAVGPFSNTATSAQLASGDVDFVSADGNTGYLLTPYGKWAWSMLVQLGYKPNPFADKDQTVSALPLLCACKAYLDYYFPNGYAHYGDYAVLDGIMQRQVTYNLSSAEIVKIFAVLYRVAYSDDYFVNAFDNPSGPNDGVGSVDFSIQDITLNNSATLGYKTTVLNSSLTGYNEDNTPVIAGTDSQGAGSLQTNLYNISQYQVENLARLTSYVRRHQLAGSRALERYLLDWGVALDADKLKRSIKINEKRFPLQVGEVMSNSDTYIPASAGNPATGAGLGDYTGRAVAYDGDLNFEFETDEFGYLFVISTIIPSVSYVQGYDRFTVHKTKTDFLTGEFDGIVTAIDSGELFVGARRSNNLGTPIGFTGNYPEYKIAKDNLSGLFLFPKTEKGLLGWETCRLWSDEVGDNAFNVVHSLDFMLGSDSDQYNRIFMDDDNIDHFMIVHRDNFEITQQALPLYDFFDWYDDDHQKVSIDVNGTKTN